jgi:hypothetical protein
MKTFVLNRIKDISGISGTGVIAEGVIFSDGKVVTHWLKEPQSTVHWNCIQDLEKINGHGGNTVIQYISVEVDKKFKKTKTNEEEAHIKGLSEKKILASHGCIKIKYLCDFCDEWDGVTHRCSCGNRRMCWELDHDIDDVYPNAF